MYFRLDPNNRFPILEKKRVESFKDFFEDESTSYNDIFGASDRSFDCEEINSRFMTKKRTRMSIFRYMSFLYTAVDMHIRMTRNSPERNFEHDPAAL